MMDFNSSSSISGRITALVDAGMLQSRARQSERQYLGASRLGVACERAVARRESESQRLAQLRAELEDQLLAQGAVVFARAAERLPNTVFFAFDNIDGETLVAQLDRAGYAVASGAACSSANPEPSHVLQAMGVSNELARGAVRISLGPANTEEQIEGLLVALQITLAKLRRLTAVAV